MCCVKYSFKHYEWTKANNNFILARDEFIGFGGGGKFGLWFDATFTQGTSESSPTYNNKCLASSEHFKVVAVEVWSFATATTKMSRRYPSGAMSNV